MEDPLTTPLPAIPRTERQIFRCFPIFLYLNTFALCTFATTIFQANTYYMTDLNWAWWEILLPLSLYCLGITITAYLTELLKNRFSTYVFVAISCLLNVSSAVLLVLYQPAYKDDRNYWIWTLGLFIMGMGSQFLSRMNNSFLKYEKAKEKGRKIKLQLVIVFGLGIALFMSTTYLQIIDWDTAKLNKKPFGDFIWVSVGLFGQGHVGQFAETLYLIIPESENSSSRDLKLSPIEMILQRRVLFVSISILFSSFVTAVLQFTIIVDARLEFSNLVWAPTIVFALTGAMYLIVMISRIYIQKWMTARVVIAQANLFTFVGLLFIHPKWWQTGESSLAKWQQYLGYGQTLFGCCLTNIFSCNEILASSAQRFKMTQRYLREKVLNLFWFISFIGNWFGILAFALTSYEDMHILFLVLFIIGGCVFQFYMYEFVDAIKWLLNRGQKGQSRPLSMKSGTSSKASQSYDDVDLVQNDTEIEDFSQNYINHEVLIGKYFTIDHFCTSSVYLGNQMLDSNYNSQGKLLKKSVKEILRGQPERVQYKTPDSQFTILNISRLLHHETFPKC